jgi:predicted lactoylglutathione lyase
MKSMKQSLDTMNLGAFSMSLAVKNLEASRRFYEKLGFKIFAGDASQNWLILKNGDHALGLFQGMFERTATRRNLMSSPMFAISNGNSKPKA